MDYSDELQTLCAPAYRLQRAGHLLCAGAFVVIVLGVLLGAIGLANELAGFSVRPRGAAPFLWLMASAPFAGGFVAMCGLFLKYCSDWLLHRRNLRFDRASKVYVADGAPFEYAARVTTLVSCLFLHIPHLVLKWWRALPD